MNYFLLFLILDYLIKQSFAKIIPILSIPINSTSSIEPSLRQYHSGVVFLTWNTTNINNICPQGVCGPFCNTTNASCNVPIGTTPIYLNKILPDRSETYFVKPMKCQKECCNNNEYCYRVINKNGDELNIPSEEVLLIFGGKVLNSLNNYPSCYWSFPLKLCDEILSNDLWYYFIEKQEWSQVYPGANPIGLTSIPSPRYGHKSVLIHRSLLESDSNSIVLRKYLYMYGGIGLECSGACNDLWVYEIPWAAQRYYPSPINDTYWNRGNHWRKINTVNGPGGRAFHSMVADKEYSYIYLFGGVYYNNSDYSYSNDLWKFSILNETWEKMTYCGISTIHRSVTLWDGNLIFSSININDEIYNTDSIDYASVNSSTYDNCYKGNVNFPKCRAFSTLSIDKNNNLYIYGGSSDSIRYLNDLWIIKKSGSHCLLETTPNFFIKDINDLAIEIYSNPNGLSSSASIYSPNDNFMFLYGGFNENGTNKELWLFNINSRLFHNNSNMIDNSSQEILFPSVKGHLFFAISKGFLIHGGVTYNKIPNENISLYQQYYNTNFANTCQIFSENQLKLRQISTINQTIYKDLAFLQSKGNPCFKESPSYQNFPDNYYPDYFPNITKYYPCNVSIDSSRGVCYFGRYYCLDGYYGDYCEKTLCFNSYCIYDLLSFSEPDCEFCSKHGICENGLCICDIGYTGNNCSIVDCQNNCSGNAGECITYFVQNQCRCDIQNKRGSDDCSRVFCLNDCGNNGYCKDGICYCNKWFNGTDCTVYNISILDFSDKVQSFLCLFLVLAIFSFEL